MYTNPFNRKHSTIRQMLDRIFDPAVKKPIRRSESVSSAGSSSSKSSASSFGSSEAPLIVKSNAIRISIPPFTRLQVCLRYLATGNSFSSIGYAFRIAKCTVSEIVEETCLAIYETSKNIFLTVPITKKWLLIAEGFQKSVIFQVVLVRLMEKKLLCSESTFFYYKGHHSLNFTGVCDSNCRFTLIEVGAEGRRSDGGIFATSYVRKAIEEDELNLPSYVNVAERLLPFIFVGNEVLSRARRTIVCGFGILVARWRIYKRSLDLGVDKIVAIVLATICFHNFVITEELQKQSEFRYYSTYTNLDRL
ncbi:uncharacterized protein LOC106643922 [Copidosoma floridanum]|uniref:uncharacterized protein LOC106643922 n=1 Tax=Copidosoma floridanum TaxID=29053 RepID=UPI0006C9DFD1|nr:uncharacterized protein LOC106643922 [Copidosoma floridanum]